VKKSRIDAVDTARGERRTDKQKTKTSLRRARSISYYAAENQRLKEELRRMTVRRADLLELWQQLETALQTLDRQTKEIRGLQEDLKTYRDMAARRGERYSEIRRVLHKVTGGEGLAACHLWRVRQLNRISNTWPLGYGQRLRSVLEEWKRENGIRSLSPPPV
jgi:chromosome segregation ATPase